MALMYLRGLKKLNKNYRPHLVTAEMRQGNGKKLARENKSTDVDSLFSVYFVYNLDTLHHQFSAYG